MSVQLTVNKPGGIFVYSVVVHDKENINKKSFTIAFSESLSTQLSYIFTVYPFNLYFLCHASWCKFRFPPTHSISAPSLICTVHPSVSLLISAPFLLLSLPLLLSFSFLLCTLSPSLPHSSSQGLALCYPRDQ